MSEQIITKQCSKCKKIKALSEFYKHPQGKNGLYPSCKTCISKYMKKYSQTEHCRAYHKAYAKKYRPKYVKTKQGRQSVHKHNLKWYRNNPTKVKAKSAVNHAITAGKIPRISTLQCSCGKRAQHYHHNKGYAKKHWLDVVPVCAFCHHKIHFKKTVAPLVQANA